MNTDKNWNTDDTDVTDGHRYKIGTLMTLMLRMTTDKIGNTDDTDVTDDHR
jgi:hypothetical protein